jgi:hypothetical protein
MKWRYSVGLILAADHRVIAKTLARSLNRQRDQD